MVERTFACLSEYRRLSKDYEFNTRRSEASVYIAMIHVTVRRQDLAILKRKRASKSPQGTCYTRSEEYKILYGYDSINRRESHNRLLLLLTFVPVTLKQQKRSNEHNSNSDNRKQDLKGLAIAYTDSD